MRLLLAWITEVGRCPAAYRLVLAAEHHELWAIEALAPLVALYADTETPLSVVEERLVEVLIFAAPPARASDRTEFLEEFLAESA